MLTADQLINIYHLQPHPEGGYFRETYRSKEEIIRAALHARFNGSRSFSTAIYFLLDGQQFSAFHRIASDEIWHFYAGGPLNIYVIHPEGVVEIIKLGSDILNGETFQAVVPAGCWFAAKPANENSFSFVGCTVAPGFDFADFELANAEDLSNEFPQHKALIKTLCR